MKSRHIGPGAHLQNIMGIGFSTILHTDCGYVLISRLWYDNFGKIWYGINQVFTSPSILLTMQKRSDVITALNSPSGHLVPARYRADAGQHRPGIERHDWWI